MMRQFKCTANVCLRKQIGRSTYRINTIPPNNFEGGGGNIPPPPPQ